MSNTNDSGAGSLRQAIFGAAPGDTITFNAALSGQTITLASTLVIDKNLTVNGSGLASKISISGNNSVRVFEVAAGTTVSFNSLRIVNGFVSGGDGGGIRNNGTLSIANGFFSGNTARWGGGIDNFGTLSITNTTFSTNTAAGAATGSNGLGGAINNLGTLNVTNCTFTNNVASADGLGGGIMSLGPLTVTNSSFSGNTARDGGAINNNTNSLSTVMQSTFSGNSAQFGGAVINFGTLNITTSTFTTNSGTTLGGAFSNGGTLTVTDSTLANNSSGGGSGIENFGTATFQNVTVRNNSSSGFGGGIYNTQDFTVVNSTFFGNSASLDGGAIDTSGTLTIINSTLSGNTASAGGSGIYVFSGGTLNYANTIVANSTSGEDCYNAGTIGTNVNNLVETNAAAPNACGTPLLSGDPGLAALANNGGPTQTMAIGLGSPAVDAANDAYCPATDQRGVRRPQDDHCDIGAYEAQKPIRVTIGGLDISSYSLAAHQSKRASYPGLSNGPVKIANLDPVPIIAAERVIYKVSGINTSYSEMMGLPDGQIDGTYWLPWYNDLDLDTQLRFGNVGNSATSVQLFIGGTEMKSGCLPSNSPYSLGPGASLRVSCPGVNNGPIQLKSSGKIVAAERVIFRVNGTNTSFSEMMGLPNGQLDSTYWLPWYNNADLDTQLRIGNVTTNQTATVRIYIGPHEMTTGCVAPNATYPYQIGPGQSLRVSCPTVNDGPVRIQSTAPIVAAERVIFRVNGTNTSFSEIMALPNSKVGKIYWLPWYNNASLDTQLRFGNVDPVLSATVHVKVGGVEVTGCSPHDSPFTLGPGESVRVRCTGLNNGPVQILSDRNIVAAERVIYTVNGVNTSYSEMMALPDSQVNTAYWLPWYNNLDLDTQLRIGVP